VAILTVLFLLLPAYALFAPETSYAKEERMVDASEIVGRIKANEPVDYEHVNVSGELDLSKLEKPVAQTVKIANSTFQDDLSFEETRFEKAVNLSGSTFRGNASFSGVQFLGDSSFVGTRFQNYTTFRVSKFDGIAPFVAASFEKDVDFDYAQFGKFASFGKTRFLGNASFSNAQFQGDVIFLGALFHKDADLPFTQFARLASFFDSRFYGETNFFNSQFSGAANFVNATFSGNLTFVGVRFSSDVVFRSASFHKDAFFGLANFDGFCDFSHTTFSGPAVFAVTKFNDIAHFVKAKFERQLVLESARIYTMQLSDANFGSQSNITLKDADFTRLLVPWDVIKDRLIYDPMAYLALVKNYRNLEWRDDANDCYYRYRRLSQAQEPWGLDKLIDMVAWLSCGYGVRPSYTIFWSLAQIIIFAGIYWRGDGIRKRYSKTMLERCQAKSEGVDRGATDDEADKDEHVALSDAIHYSAMIFTNQNPSDVYSVGVHRHVAMIEGLIGWFLLGLFIVVLSGTLIR
jgi:hypothetical protein